MSESLEPDEAVHAGQVPPRMVAGPWHSAPSPSWSPVLSREARGRVAMSRDTPQLQAPKPRDRTVLVWNASQQRGLLPDHTRARGGRQKLGGVQRSSTLGPQMSTSQPSAGKMTSLPSPVRKVQPPHVVSPRDWAGDCLGWPPALWRAPGPMPRPHSPGAWGGTSSSGGAPAGLLGLSLRLSKRGEAAGPPPRSSTWGPWACCDHALKGVGGSPGAGSEARTQASPGPPHILECTCIFIAHACLPCCQWVLSNPRGTFSFFVPKK